jgi:quercetin dioxygenase-like cupin family protein
MHTHSGAYHGVVIKGVMTNPFEGEINPPKLPPGSYWYVPADAVHATACVSNTPCEFYFHADSAFDFTPVK